MPNHAPNSARVFLLEYEAADGRRQLYRDALPARTAFAAARQMARDGLRPRVVRVVITPADLDKLPSRSRPFWRRQQNGPSR